MVVQTLAPARPQTLSTVGDSLDCCHTSLNGQFNFQHLWMFSFDFYKRNTKGALAVSNKWSISCLRMTSRKSGCWPRTGRMCRLTFLLGCRKWLRRSSESETRSLESRVLRRQRHRLYNDFLETGANSNRNCSSIAFSR